MAELYKVDSPINRVQRNNLNSTFEDILKRFVNLQKQINTLSGDNNIDVLIQAIEDALSNSQATLTDLQGALNDAQQSIGEIITATTNANTATTSANEATSTAVQLIADMVLLENDLTQLLAALNASINNANQATTSANTATTNANQATQDAQQATSEATNAATRANEIAGEIEGWGQAVAFKNGVNYARNNVVTFEGSTYQSLVDNNKALPTDSTKWIVLAHKGLDGQGAVQTVNNQMPDSHGNVTIDKSHITGLETNLTNISSSIEELEGVITTHLDKTNTLTNEKTLFTGDVKLTDGSIINLSESILGYYNLILIFGNGSGVTGVILPNTASSAGIFISYPVNIIIPVNGVPVFISIRVTSETQMTVVQGNNAQLRQVRVSGRQEVAV